MARARHLANRQGITLVDLLLGTMLLVSGTAATVLALQQSSRYGDFLAQRQVALYAVHGRLEQLTAIDVETLWNDPVYAPARALGGLAEPQPLSDLPEAMLTIQIRNADPLDAVNPALLDVQVAFCWRYSGWLVTGEDVNCDGVLDALEDANGNQWMDAPVAVSTRLARHE